MAAKKEAGLLRGAKLMKKAIESAKASGVIDAPEPMPSSLIKKLVLPNGENLSPAMKELFAYDASWLGIDYDEDEAEIEPMSLEEVLEEHFGDDGVAAFGEAVDLLGEDCVFFGAELDVPACLYVGEADEAGEYPVLSFTYRDGVARIGGFVPFDVWAAQELGALERGKTIGDVPSAYAALPEAMATENGDGRVVFAPKAGEGRDEDGEDDEEDEDDEEEDDDLGGDDEGDGEGEGDDDADEEESDDD